MNAAVRSDAISIAQIARARVLAASSGRPVVDELEKSLELDPDSFMNGLCHVSGIQRLTLFDCESYAPDFSRISFAQSMAERCVFASDRSGMPHLIFADPFDATLEARRSFQWREAHPALMHSDEIKTWLSRCEEQMTALPAASARSGEGVSTLASAEELSLARIGRDVSPVIQFVNSTLYDALKAGASDIHLESDPGGLTVKFRLDGVLSNVGHMNGTAMAEQVLSRVKVMSELDIAERRIPQDGRLQVLRDGRAIDVRVSVMPSIHGEDAVLRILDRQALAAELSGLSLTGLGFPEHTAAQIRRLASMPYGMLLVTGPTGSGKTTTLYAALSDTYNPQEKTITIEDPVEYHLPGILQIPVNEKKRLTFAVGLRSILRHDPDRILVGEIRDAETAQIAVQSSLTGHMVFTTVHANGVLDVFGRFVQFGIDPYAFASAINGILAQRLLRRLCAACSRPEELVSSETSAPWMRAVGCAHCRGTGYRGRFAIGEVLRLDANLKSIIAERGSLAAIGAAAEEAGLVTLRSQAVSAARAGMTTLDEVNRVTVE